MNKSNNLKKTVKIIELDKDAKMIAIKGYAKASDFQSAREIYVKGAYTKPVDFCTICEIKRMNI